MNIEGVQVSKDFTVTQKESLKELLGFTMELAVGPPKRRKIRRGLGEKARQTKQANGGIHPGQYIHAVHVRVCTGVWVSLPTCLD